MTCLEPMRPAARSAAVRPHSSFLPSPRPAPPWSLGASRWRASLFFAPITPALLDQLTWLASACRASGRGGVVTVTRLVTALGTRKPLQSLDISEPLPRYRSPPAHVIRSRARACASSSFPLVTWEHEIIVYVERGLTPFPRPFPRLYALVTWERPEGGAACSDRLRAGSNKVEVGNGDLQRPGGDARRKFRAPIARLAAAGELDIQQRRTRRGDIGGFPPFVSAPGRRVGRAMLEGCRQAAENAGDLATCRKLGRLRGSALGELGAGAIEPLALAAAGGDRPGEAPGAPNRSRAPSAMLALHARPIWIEDRAQGGFSRGHYSNRRLGVWKNAQTGDRWRGPGGECSSKAAAIAVGARNREARERAGVNFLRQVGRPHEAGGKPKLLPVFPGVKRADFAAVDKVEVPA